MPFNAEDMYRVNGGHSFIAYFSYQFIYSASLTGRAEHEVAGESM